VRLLILTVQDDSLNNYRDCTLHGLGSLTCSVSELTSETMNPFRQFHRTPWTGEDRPILRHIQDKNMEIQPCLEWNSKQRSQCSNGTRP